MLQELEFGSFEPLPLSVLLLNLAVGGVISLLLRWHFIRFGSTLSNRRDFSLVFPFICMITVLIISVVKSSLALSLGLVGALSIVRFRTPIKEPEELAYLFAAIAVGLGLGAGQTLATVVATALILAVVAAVQLSQKSSSAKNLFLSIEAVMEENVEADNLLQQINDLIGKHAAQADLRRFDIRGRSLEATYMLHISDTQALSQLSTDLRAAFPQVNVTFLDQSRIPNL